MSRYVLVIHDEKSASSSYGKVYNTLMEAMADKLNKEDDRSFKADRLTRDKTVSVAQLLDLGDMEVVTKRTVALTNTDDKENSDE